MTGGGANDAFSLLARSLRACRVCADAPLYPPPLPHEPNPLVQGSATARLCVAAQAPGLQADRKSKTFADPSGIRLRRWLGLSDAEFYDASRVAVIPMGSCFPGFDARDADLPPRRECAELWRNRLFSALPDLRLILVIGQYAQHWHMPQQRGWSLTERVRNGLNSLNAPGTPSVALPHPSWRNNRWLKDNPWFEADLLPVLRVRIREIVTE
ncbi:MAG: uracil-DNA glycosylase family protein [Methylobacteriaceae bacterium]|jgi:uracil-DNA glycosylase|nr:uracil-DNA glycosylase family protein [Methylobacteriaceae bacterium]